MMFFTRVFIILTLSYFGTCITTEHTVRATTVKSNHGTSESPEQTDHLAKLCVNYSAVPIYIFSTLFSSERILKELISKPPTPIPVNVICPSGFRLTDDMQCVSL